MPFLEAPFAKCYHYKSHFPFGGDFQARKEQSTLQYIFFRVAELQNTWSASLWQNLKDWSIQESHFPAKYRLRRSCRAQAHLLWTRVAGCCHSLSLQSDVAGDRREDDLFEHGHIIVLSCVHRHYYFLWLLFLPTCFVWWKILSNKDSSLKIAHFKFPGFNGYWMPNALGNGIACARPRLSAFSFQWTSLSLESLSRSRERARRQRIEDRASDNSRK